MKIKDCVLIEPFTCKENEGIIEVAKKLRKISLRHIFVVDNEDYPTGIISVMDINNRIVAEGKNPKDLKAKDIMSKPIEAYNFNESVEDAYKKMIDKQRVMGAVIRDKKMNGIVTIHQLLKKLENKKNE